MQGIEMLPLGERYAAPDRGIILIRIRRGRVQHDEAHGRPITPSSGQRVAVESASGNDCIVFHHRKSRSSATRRLSFGADGGSISSFMALLSKLSDGSGGVSIHRPSFT